MGRNLVCIRANKISPYYLKEYFLSTHIKKEKKIKESTGTILNSLHVKSIEKLRIIVPIQEILNNFILAIKPIHEIIQNNLLEINILSQIRDSLLPKLMSGKIRVK